MEQEAKPLLTHLTEKIINHFFLLFTKIYFLVQYSDRAIQQNMFIYTGSYDSGGFTTI